MALLFLPFFDARDLFRYIEFVGLSIELSCLARIVMDNPYGIVQDFPKGSMYYAGLGCNQHTLELG